MRDHKIPLSKSPEYCPLMKEICTEGWTPAMGQDEKQIRPRCKAWQPVTVNNPLKQPALEQVFDCSIFGWGPDLMCSLADEVDQSRAQTHNVEKAMRTEVGRASYAIARLTGMIRMGLKRAGLPTGGVSPALEGKPHNALETGKGGQNGAG